MECLVLGKPIQFLNLVHAVFTPESKGSDHYNLGFLRTYYVPGCVLRAWHTVSPGALKEGLIARCQQPLLAVPSAAT